MSLFSLYQQKTIKNYQKLLAKDVKDQCIGANIGKSENKNSTDEYRYFLKSNFLCVSRLFLIYSNEDDNAKRYTAKRYYLPKCITKNYNTIIDGKNVYDQPIDSDTKRYEEKRKLTITT